MEQVYLTSVQAAGMQSQYKNKPKPPPPPSDRMNALEKELRGDLQQTKTSTSNEQAGTASKPLLRTKSKRFIKSSRGL